MHTARRIPLAVALAVLALPALTACGDDNDAPGVVTLEVSGDQLRIPDTFTTRVRYVVRNNSTAAISVFRCEGQTMHFLERRIREPDEWMQESGVNCNLFPTETIVLEPGESHRDSITARRGFTYRLRVPKLPAGTSGDPSLQSRNFVVPQ